jgi:hypothetical protein
LNADLLVSHFFMKRCYHYVSTRDTRTHKIGVELYVALVVEILESSKDWTSLPFTILVLSKKFDALCFSRRVVSLAYHEIYSVLLFGSTSYGLLVWKAHSTLLSISEMHFVYLDKPYKSMMI